MEISVRQTSIKPTYIRHLLTNGIVLVSHLNTFDATRLSQKIRLAKEECEKILATIKPKRPHYIMEASELMINPFERISTLINGLDPILGGGISCGHLTEISGEAGAGKSNLCAKIGTLVMLPKDNRGHDGDVLLIHTEGEGKLKLAIKRFSTLAASVEREDLIKSKLHVMNCGNAFELVEIVSRLPDILSKRKTVKLIIIDSMTCAFISPDGITLDYDFYNKRSLQLTKIVKVLIQIAWDKRVAILATNHVSYNPKFGENRPALGKIWSHMCQTKIYLERKDGYNIARFAHVNKGAMLSPSIIKFSITNDLFDPSD